jgi:hypothetical protein
VKFNDNIFIIFEGLSGFLEEGGMVFLGLSMKATDSQGELILDEHDLIGDMSMEVSKVKSQIAPNFIFSGSNMQNPVTCTVSIWDKKSKNSIKATVDLNVK